MLSIVKVILVLLVSVNELKRVTPEPANPFHTDNIVWLRSCWERNIIPFQMDKGFTLDQSDFIYRMIAIFHKDTCLRWVEFTSLNMQESPGNEKQPDRISSNSGQMDGNIDDLKNSVRFIKVGDGRCRSERILRDNNTVVSYIKLLDQCFKQNAVIHEMMHALGFHHEHQRADRNCYVSVSPEVENLPNYKIQPHEPWLERYPYDKFSVLHYARSFLMQSRRRGRKRQRSDFLGNPYGQLTHLDLSKIQYKFCGGPHYCDVSPEDCRVAADWRQRRGCVRS